MRSNLPPQVCCDYKNGDGEHMVSQAPQREGGIKRVTEVNTIMNLVRKMDRPAIGFLVHKTRIWDHSTQMTGWRFIANRKKKYAAYRLGHHKMWQGPWDEKGFLLRIRIRHGSCVYQWLWVTTAKQNLVHLKAVSSECPLLRTNTHTHTRLWAVYISTVCFTEASG